MSFTERVARTFRARTRSEQIATVLGILSLLAFVALAILQLANGDFAYLLPIGAPLCIVGQYSLAWVNRRERRGQAIAELICGILVTLCYSFYLYLQITGTL